MNKWFCVKMWHDDTPHDEEHYMRYEAASEQAALARAQLEWPNYHHYRCWQLKEAEQCQATG